MTKTSKKMTKIFVNGFQFDALIGVYDHEKGRTQPLIAHIKMSVDEGEKPLNDEIENVVCYHTITKKIAQMAKAVHVQLLETLAENIAAEILKDKRIKKLTLRLEKPHAIKEASSVGVEIERMQA